MHQPPDCLRLDRLMKPAGLIKSAAMFSAFLYRDRLHFVRTGSGWTELRQGAMQRAITQQVVRRKLKKIEQIEATLNGIDPNTDLQSLSEIVYPPFSLRSVELTPVEALNKSRLVLKSVSAKPKRLVLDLPNITRFEDIRAFVEAIRLAEPESQSV